MSYSTGDLERILDLTYAQQMQIHRWRMAGAITPSVRAVSGIGTRAAWSGTDLARLRCIFRLVDQFRASNLQLPVPIVADVWLTLGNGEPWQLCFNLSLEPVSV